MNSTLGENVFKNIETDEYLQELFDAIRYNYSLDLFKQRNERRQFNLNDALRFSDLLSKSIDPLHSDLHKVWAQEIVALLHGLYPENQQIKSCMGSVLANVCNYRGMALRQSSFSPINSFESAYEEYKKSLLRIPCETGCYFFKAQREIFNSLTKDRFSYSGPTSIGKSFVIRMFIKEQIRNGSQKNFAIVVPTKALINEVSGKIIDDLKELLAEKDYRIITVGGAISLRQKHNFILVLTPERLLYLLLERPCFQLDYLFVDEAHKISSRDSRSPFYYKLVELLSRRTDKPHFIFSAPNIPNPDVYLKLTNSNEGECSEKLTTYYSPVSQMKYLVDLIRGEIKLYNDYGKKFVHIGQFKKCPSFTKVLSIIGINKQNIVYCNATAKAVEYAREYARPLPVQDNNPELMSLSREIKEQIHQDYYLAELITKGVAYHIGYLPSSIRLRIEDLFRAGVIKTIFCTSTLIEGVNLPADNLFIMSYKNGRSCMTSVEFKNLIGRVGRIEFNLFGNVFLMRTENAMEVDNYIELVGKEVPMQKLSIVSELTKRQKKAIVDSLAKGNIEFLNCPDQQTAENYSLMRKFALILLNDVILGRNSFVKKEFSEFLSNEIEDAIRTAFSDRSVDDDINISTDQVDNITAAIKNGLTYPELDSDGRIEYKKLMQFLEKLFHIFKWEKYEKSTLGHVSSKTNKPGKLRWYAVILSQWIKGNGLGYIMQHAISYKRKNPSPGVEINGRMVDYDDSIEHRNVIISDTLGIIEEIILFRLSNYFLRFSTEYKKIYHVDVIPNDWHEYVEYGTIDKMAIFLQRNGFTRDAATYIKKHREHIAKIDGEYKVRDTLLHCGSKAVSKEAEEIKYNIPELFI